MSGISEALVATAVGLLVAIPAVVAYNLFQRRVKRTMGESESFAQSALGLIVSEPDAAKPGAGKKVEA
jgi:biopolymer transport protein ExbB